MVGAIQTDTNTVFHTPHEVLQSALADSVLFLEKASVGRAQISDISDSLAEYKRLFSVKLASPAEILTLARAFPDNQKFAKAAEKIEDDKMPVVVGGPASVEMVDREGHLITTDALTKAFDNYMKNFRTRNVMVMHSDVQVGHALPAYITKGGSVFRSGVDPKGLFFITELRNDTRIAAKVKEQIESGKMRSYSIAGNATESKDIHKEDGTKIMQVNNLELAEVTICEKGVNQGAHFDLMKGMILDKENSTPPPVHLNDLSLEDTLSKLKKAIGTTSRGVRREGDRRTASQVNYGGRSPRPDRYKNIDRTTIRGKRGTDSEQLGGIEDDAGYSAEYTTMEPDQPEGFKHPYTTTISDDGNRVTHRLGAPDYGHPDFDDQEYDHMPEEFSYVKDKKGTWRAEGESPFKSTDSKTGEGRFKDNIFSGSKRPQYPQHSVSDNPPKFLPKSAQNIQKSTPLLGMFQNFMEKEKKHSTDTPLGKQTVHPDQEGEEKRRKQLECIQREFGLPEKTVSAEYNRYAPVEYKHPNSFSSTRVVNQSGQDLAPPQIGHEYLIHSTEKIKSLQKARPGGLNPSGRPKLSPGHEESVDDCPSCYKPAQYGAGDDHWVSPAHEPRDVRRARNHPDTASDVSGYNPDFRNSIDKVLFKLFQKAGKDKEDRTPSNSPTPNEFPADTSPSPYQSKGLFEKQHSGEAAQNYGGRGNPAQQRATARARGQEADIPPEDPEFESESSYGPYDDRIDPDLQEDYKRAEAAEKLAEQGGEGWTRGKTPRTGKLEGHTPIVDPRPEYPTAAESASGEMDRHRWFARPEFIGRPGSARTGTTSRGFRQEGGAGRKASFRGIEGGRRPRPTRYKDVGRETGRAFDDSVASPKQETDYAPPALKNSMQKQVRPPQGTDVAGGSGVRSGGMPQRRGKQGPTVNWGDPTRAAQPTLEQRLPWDEKSLEKNENPIYRKPSGKPSLRRGALPTHDEDAAAANRARVEATKGQPHDVEPGSLSPAPDPAQRIMEREVKRKPGSAFPSSRSEEKSLEKAPPSLGRFRGPEPHDEAGAAANRRRVAAGRGKPPPTPVKRTRDIATQAVDREAKRRERGDPGFPKRASLLKTTDSSADDVHRPDLPPLHGFGAGGSARRVKEAAIAREQRMDDRQRQSDTTGLPVPEDLPTDKERQRLRFRQAQNVMAQETHGTGDERGKKNPSAGIPPRLASQRRGDEFKRLRSINPESFDDPRPPHLSNSLEKEDAIKTGKAILALPYNLATQRLMGKDAPPAVSADDRLKQAVLVLLKQTDVPATAQEVGRSLLGDGEIGIDTVASKLGSAAKKIGSPIKHKTHKPTSPSASAGLDAANPATGSPTTPSTTPTADTSSSNKSMEKGLGSGLRNIGRAALSDAAGGAAKIKQGIQNIGKPKAETMYSTRHGEMSASDPRFPSNVPAGEMKPAGYYDPPSDPSKRIGGREETTPVTPAKPKPRGQAGVDPNVTIRPEDTAAQARARGNTP